MRTLPRTVRRGIRSALPSWLPVALLAASAACGSAPAEPRPNLILVSLDTLRADRLSCYGYERETSPRIDALARAGALFENAVAEAPWTLPSHATMLTGLAPETHGVNLPSRRLPGSTATLAQILSDAGYATLGLTEGGYLARNYGLARGFDVYSENRPSLAASLDSARDLLAQAREGDFPWFLFLHTYDIHCPYDAPAEHVELFRTEGEEPVVIEGSCGDEFNAQPLTAGQVRTISNRYDAGIHAVDALLGGFLDELAEAGMLANTYVVVTSDHGEQLYEHGRIGHERSVHRENLVVPWIVTGPDIAPRRITAPCGLADMTPTLLGLVGLEVPAGLDGSSRAGWLRGTEAPPGAAGPRFSELSWKVDLESVLTPTHQLIVETETDRATLYRLTPTGSEPLTPPDATLERELRGHLTGHRAGITPHAAEAAPTPDAAQTEKLRALGYGD